MLAGSTLASVRAGGTREVTEEIATPGAPRRIRLLVEIGLLFLVVPILVTYAVYGLRIPLFLALQPILIGTLAYLLWDPTFGLRQEARQGVSRATLLNIALIFIVVGGAITAYMAHTYPRNFLAFPRYRPQLWLSVLVLYPLLSVLAQELVFRTFFFHRYGPLFGERRWLAVLTNGVLFSFAHVMFYNPVALVATWALGTLLAWRYSRTRSLWAVTVEHTLYGWLIFTVGLGGYFFTGITNPRL